MSSSVIRLAGAHDAAQIQAIYAPAVIHTPATFETEPPTVEEMRQRISIAENQFPWLICEKDGEVAGYVYASSHRARVAYMWSVEVSVYIHPRHQRSGIGKALYSSLFRILTLQGFYNAYAGITLPNPASVGLHESLGFRPVGVYEAVGYKMGAWHSVGWWSLALQERFAAPTPPLSLDAIIELPDWIVALNAGLPFLKP